MVKLRSIDSQRFQASRNQRALHTNHSIATYCMKSLTTAALALAIVAGVGAVGAHSVDAFGGFRGGEDGGFKGGMHRIHSGENALVPEELRSEWRTEKRALLEDMTDEERQEYFEERRAERQEHREAKTAAFEEFVGLDKEEIRELKADGQSMGDILESQGITEDEAEDFLTERANDKVDDLVERHDLSEADENTLRDRIANFVQNILDRWFNS